MFYLTGDYTAGAELFLEHGGADTFDQNAKLSLQCTLAEADARALRRISG